MKSTNQKVGALKRQFKMGRADFEPGVMISKVNETKKELTNQPKFAERLKVAIAGLV